MAMETMVVKMLIYLLSLWFFTPLCQGRQKSWEDEYPFIKPASSFVDGDHDYDYIIVGGGATGCPLAATLSQNFRVLLLERGDVPFDNVNISYYDNLAYNLMDTSPKSASQAFVSTDGVPNSRGKALGGGTCINAGFYSRASTRYIVEEGWDVELAHESYTWIERQIVHQPKLKRFQRTFLNGLLEAGVLPFNGFTYDHLYGTKISGTIFDKYNRRHTAATLLASGKAENLEVLIHATVQRLLFTKIGKRLLVTGVEFEDEHHIRHQALLSNDKRMKSEIILSSGTIGSPQILLLSGIGPRDDLLKLNISMVVENGFVGKSMFDCSANYAFVSVEGKVDKSPIQVAGIAKEGVYIEALGGLNLPLKAILFDQKYDSIQRMQEAMHVNNKEIDGGYLLSKVSKPISRGQMNLISNSVYDQPLVTFNYYSSKKDLSICVNGLKLMKKTISSNSFQNITNNHKESNGTQIDFDDDDEESLKKLCKETVGTIYHNNGGCNVGRVVDNDYKVYGVERLRVIDGSIFDETPGTNPQATYMMLGRYMGVKILTNRLGIAYGDGV